MTDGVIPLSPSMNVADCAHHLRRTEKAVRGLVYRGEIPHRKVGARLEFNRGDVDRWLARHNRRGAMV